MLFRSTVQVNLCAGAEVHLYGCIGRDAMGDFALRLLRSDGVVLAGVRRVDPSTGLALIHVEDAGENCITVVAGANAEARAAQFPTRSCTRQQRS